MDMFHFQNLLLIFRDFSVEHKSEREKYFRHVGDVDRKFFRSEIDCSVKNFFRISEKGNLFHTYRVQLEPLEGKLLKTNSL